MIIKVCGMTDAENITAVEHLGADMIGMVFYPQSPRYVQMVRSRAGSMPDYSRERLDQLQRHLDDGAAPMQKPAHVPRVGVFVDDMPQNIVTRVYNYGLDYVQLHGDESRITCDNLRRTIDPDIRPGLRIIKAIPVADARDIDRWREYDGAVDMLLFDTRSDSVGGSGNRFDWTLLDRYDGDIPFLLGGGIGPDDVDRVRAFHHPQFVGHSVPGHHGFCQSCGLTDILRSSCGDIFKDQLLSDPAAQADHDMLQHLSFCLKHIILLRQGHSIAGSSHTGRNNGDRIYRLHIRQYMKQDGMARLVIRRDLFLFLRDHPAFLFHTDTDLDKCTLDILLHDEHAVVLGRQYGSFIQKAFQLSAGKTGCRLGDLVKIHILSQRFVFGMYL